MSPMETLVKIFYNHFITIHVGMVYDGRYMVTAENCYVKERPGALWGAYGKGSTPDAAALDYVKTLKKHGKVVYWNGPKKEIEFTPEQMFDLELCINKAKLFGVQ